MRFTIFTLSHRRLLLPSVARSVAEAEIPSDVEMRWQVRFNPTHRLPPDEHFRRLDAEIRGLKDTWFFQLSDDNLLHRDIVKRWRDVIETHPHIKAIHVRQQFGPKSFRPAGKDHLRGGRCDGGQVIFNADFYNSFGWSYTQFRMPSSSWEGDVYMHMRERNPEAFYFLDETLAYHDRLNW